MFTQEDIKEIGEYVKNTPGNIYIGGDSLRYKKGDQNWAKFTVVLIVHINNKNGGKIFHFTEKEQVYDRKGKPGLRLMTEVMKVTDTYLQLQPVLGDRHVEIHLDLNSSEKYASNQVLKEAIGYVQGMTGIKPLVKPESWAASHTGDHYVRGKHQNA